MDEAGIEQRFGALEERLREQQQTLQHQSDALGRQQEIIDAQAAKIARLEGRGDVAARRRRDGDQDVDAPTPGDLVTDRRRMLRTAGAAMVGGIAGTTALAVAQASPAAAASGSFDGDPAVTATGVGGPAVVASRGSNGDVVTVTGTSPFGGPAAVGVRAVMSGANGIGVRGEAMNTASIGVLGVSGSTGVLGDGPSVGVHGRGGTGVLATSGEPGGVGVHSVAETSLKAEGLVMITNASELFDPIVAVESTVTGGGGTAIKASAEGPSSIGLLAESDSFGLVALGSTAVAAEGLAVGVVAAGASANLLLSPGASGDGPPAGFHGLGELYCDTQGAVWLCVGSGEPGTWRSLAGPKAAGAFHILPATQRIFDSRPGTQPPETTSNVKGRFGHATERVIACNLEQAIAGVPNRSTAVLVNLTATDTSSGGFFAAFKNGITYPGNSSLNWGSPNMTIANSAVVAIDDTQRFKVRCEGPASPAKEAGAHLVIDLVGYFR